MLKEPWPNMSKGSDEKRQRNWSPDTLLADVHPTPAQYEVSVLNSISNDRLNMWTITIREHYNATGCNDCGTGVRFTTGERHFSLPHSTHIVSWARPNSHSMGNRASGQSKWVVKLSTHFHVMRRIKNHEATHALHHMPSRRGAQLSTRRVFTFMVLERMQKKAAVA